jgi:hypothetical protein
MKAITLNATKAGMTRLRDKGGADPSTLFELTNGYVNASRLPTQRPGTRWKYTWPAHTKGLMAFKNVLYAFSPRIIDTGREDYVVLTVRHPNADFTGEIASINFCAPMLGYPIVSVTFEEDGDIEEFTGLYWLRIPGKWKPNTMYKEGDRVEPATANGYYYEAHASENPPAWAAGVERAVGDVVQPTTYNGYKYTVVDTSGGSTGTGGGGGDPAPEGRILTTSLTYSDGVVPGVDTTKFMEMFGRISRLDTPGDWPYRSGSSPAGNIPGGGYFALEMNVPADADTVIKRIKSVSYGGGAPLQMSISADPGDFDVGTAVIVVDNVEANDNPALNWRAGTGGVGVAGLTAGSTYFVNIRPMDAEVGTAFKLEFNG